MTRISLSLAVTASIACAHGAHPVAPAITSTSPALASPALASPAYALRDGFDLGVSRGVAVGLDRDLSARQTGSLAPITWSRVGGAWFVAPTPDASMSDLRRAPGGDGDALFLHGNTAVRLDHAFAPSASGLTVRARLDPVVGDTAGESWMSVILTNDPETCAWVARLDAVPGLMVRSNGQMNVFHRNRERLVVWDTAPLTAAPSYALSLTVALEERRTEGRALMLRGEVNGRRFHAALEEGTSASLSPRVWVAFGAHFHEGDARESWLDDVEVSANPAVE